MLFLIKVYKGDGVQKEENCLSFPSFSLKYIQTWSFGDFYWGGRDKAQKGGIKQHGRI